jgi:hypothetical protein
MTLGETIEILDHAFMYLALSGDANTRTSLDAQSIIFKAEMSVREEKLETGVE